MNAPEPLPLATVREWLKAERWEDLATALGAPAPGTDLPLDAVSAAYRANTKLGRADLAEAWLDVALRLSPTQSTWQRDKGVLHQKRGDWALAAACFREAVARAPR
jgi:tetratricopeptide (TPR) repeat protein